MTDSDPIDIAINVAIDGPQAEPAGVSLGAILAFTLAAVLALGGLWLAKLQVDLWNQPTIDQLRLELKPVKGGTPVVVVRNTSSSTVYALGLDRNLLFFGLQLKEGADWKAQPILRGCIVSEIPIKPGDVLRIPCAAFDNPEGRPMRVSLEVTAKVRKTLFGGLETATLGTATSNAL